MPERVLGPYKRFLEHLVIYNTISGGLGAAYTKPTTIPQGDPMSMMVTALILRPWIEQMKSVAVEPRVLADDLQIVASGPRHLENYVHASDLTHAHLHDMGARLAAQKSISFTSEPAARKWLRNHKWRRIGGKIPVITDVRGLGAHWTICGKLWQPPLRNG